MAVGSAEGRVEGATRSAVDRRPCWQKIRPLLQKWAETSEGWNAPKGRPGRAERGFMDSAQRKALSRHSSLACRSQGTIAPIFAVILFVALAARSVAQLATSATSTSSKPEPALALDPLRT